MTSYTSSRFQTEEFRTHLHKHEGSTELVIPFNFHGLNMECPSQAPVLLHVVLGWWQSVEAVNLQEVGPSWREGVTEAGALRRVAQPYFYSRAVLLRAEVVYPVTLHFGCCSWVPLSHHAFPTMVDSGLSICNSNKPLFP